MNKLWFSALGFFICLFMILQVIASGVYMTPVGLTYQNIVSSYLYDTSNPVKSASALDQYNDFNKNEVSKTAVLSAVYLF